MFTAADTVIFLEHDWNPHVDLQAMDRAHRLGQNKPVHVYKLVVSDSIEEKVMKYQDIKMATSKIIVNSDNSTLYSMGTDRLLDIFKTRSESISISSSSECRNSSLWVDDEGENYLDSLVERYAQDYESLSVEAFVRGFDRD